MFDRDEIGLDKRLSFTVKAYESQDVMVDPYRCEHQMADILFGDGHRCCHGNLFSIRKLDTHPERF